MYGRLNFIILLFLGWVGLFEISRLAFLLYYFDKAKEISFGTAAESLLYGFRMDMSMAAYFMLVVCLMIIGSIFIKALRNKQIYKIYSYFLLLFVLIVVICDLEVYKQWGFRMDSSVIKFLKTPREAWGSVSHLPVALYLLILFSVYLGLCWCTNKLINYIGDFLKPTGNKFVSLVTVLFITTFLVFAVRGGMQLAPLSQSSVYYSTDNFANQSAINPVWNFVHGVMHKTSSTYNPYKYLAPERVKTVIDSLYSASGKSQQIVNNKSRPNLIFVVWESFTSKALDTTLEGQEIVPRFKELIREGVYFDHIYASGDITAEGLPAIFSGYPAMPGFSVIEVPAKSSKLPGLPNLLKQNGYETQFYYGGEPEWANFKSYFLQAGFDKLTSLKNFDPEIENSRWGIHDGTVLKKITADFDKIKQPFFTGWLTLSSHENFDLPITPFFKGTSITEKFFSSLHYTDEVVYDFVQICKQQSWWDNTIIVIMADHGKPWPYNPKRANNFRIPMLWLGGALQKKDTVISKLGSQVDFAATISNQFGIKNTGFTFSKDLLDSATHPWGFFAFGDGFGFVQPKGRFTFDNVGKLMAESDGVIAEKDIEAGKAIQQWTFQNYLNR